VGQRSSNRKSWCVPEKKLSKAKACLKKRGGLVPLSFLTKKGLKKRRGEMKKEDLGGKKHIPLQGTNRRQDKHPGRGYFPRPIGGPRKKKI